MSTSPFAPDTDLAAGMDPRSDDRSSAVHADLRLVDWAPRSMLTAARTPVERTCVPAIDIHNHLGRWLTDGEWCTPDVDALLALMDATGLAAVVNLDGMWGTELEANLDRYDRAHPGRFLTFCQVDWTLLAGPGGEEAIADQLRDGAARGARGLKVWKNLGLEVRDATGTLVLPDDPRVIRTLGLAGTLGMPVLIHVADPKAFFDPLDRCNERVDELFGCPDWSFADSARFPTFGRLLDAFATLLAATPGTQYVGAHVGCVAEDLDHVERLLRGAPNLVVDLGGRLAEIGRQPRRFARLIADLPDRFLFGTDAFPLTADQVRRYVSFLETTDESFDYSAEEIPPQGRWTISGSGLPRDLLERVYSGNARRVLGLP
ncbi:Predicted metal-dependent hydrolase, TIM-barrel fold [Sanguibacter gelidistatuariae]|uniref:Predicted metal-dependent hydrolase, TIM-barrel fold n=1 Tax=Sanguibacter gelidistatuariae TaxID=1814289 RepID=A0A1G6H8A5_9MICO|nr:amidohydrolase family protein [Sanguibacter gelidistatuariae]SDB90519.1 Predicted metal-dependent hydrolase, TIM-barrel fold [Sanguibacter gelidistatuariae]